MYTFFGEFANPALTEPKILNNKLTGATKEISKIRRLQHQSSLLAGSPSLAGLNPRPPPGAGLGSASRKTLVTISRGCKKVSLIRSQPPLSENRAPSHNCRKKRVPPALLCLIFMHTKPTSSAPPRTGVQGEFFFAHILKQPPVISYFQPSKKVIMGQLFFMLGVLKPPPPIISNPLLIG